RNGDAQAVIDVAGGPGVASTSGAAELLRVFAYVYKDRDLVLYDQRGTGGSNPLHCNLHQGVPPEQATDFLPEQGVRSCYEEIAGRADITKYNTAESVQDLDELRAALGYDKVILHALSYGPRLAQADMQAHPEHVGAAILEGALRPGERIPLRFARGMQTTLTALLDDCRRDAVCRPVGEQIDLGRIAAMNEIAFESGGARLRFTPPQFFEALRSLLYDGESSRLA